MVTYDRYLPLFNIFTSLALYSLPYIWVVVIYLYLLSYSNFPSRRMLLNCTCSVLWLVDHCFCPLSCDHCIHCLPFDLQLQVSPFGIFKQTSIRFAKCTVGIYSCTYSFSCHNTEHVQLSNILLAENRGELG
jgi:hypothetical protein